MKKYFLILLTMPMVLFWHWACMKGNPVGADVYNPATPTPTPIITTITVSVLDGTTPQSGITVVAAEPSGVLHTTITGVDGIGAFTTQTFGTWNIQVPTQGNFYNSSVAASVVANTLGPSITFTAQGQQLAVSPLTAENYGIAGSNITYQVTYTQPSNLIQPVVLSTTGAITATGWTANFSPVTIGQIGNTSQLNIIVPANSSAQPNFQVLASRLDGTPLLTSAARYISKNYSMQMIWIVNSVSVGGTHTLFGNLSLSSFNVGDSSTSWVVSISSNSNNNGNLSTSEGTFSNGVFDTFQILPGTLKPITVTCTCLPPNFQSSLTILSNLSSAAGSAQGGVFIDNGCTIIGGSYFALTQ